MNEINLIILIITFLALNIYYLYLWGFICKAKEIATPRHKIACNSIAPVKMLGQFYTLSPQTEWSKLEPIFNTL